MYAAFLVAWIVLEESVCCRSGSSRLGWIRNGRFSGCPEKYLLISISAKSVLVGSGPAVGADANRSEMANSDNSLYFRGQIVPWRCLRWVRIGFNCHDGPAGQKSHCGSTVYGSLERGHLENCVGLRPILLPPTTASRDL